MCGDVVEPRMGQSRERYVISGEMDTNKIQDRETHRVVSVIFSILRYTGTRIDMATMIMRNFIWSRGCWFRHDK